MVPRLSWLRRAAKEAAGRCQSGPLPPSAPQPSRCVIFLYPPTLTILAARHAAALIGLRKGSRSCRNADRKGPHLRGLSGRKGPKFRAIMRRPSLRILSVAVSAVMLLPRAIRALPKARIRSPSTSLASRPAMPRTRRRRSTSSPRPRSFWGGPPPTRSAYGLAAGW